MKRRNLMVIIYSAFLAPVAVFMLSMSGLSGPGDDSTNQSRIDQRKRAVLARPHPDSTYEGTGWLIHNGQLIPAPYEVVVHDSSITINGLHVYPKIRPEPKDTIEIDSSIRAMARLSDEFWELFPLWIDSLGRELAFKRAVAFMQDHEIVDTAYLVEPGQKGPGDMKVVYKTWHGHEVAFDLESSTSVKFAPQPEGWQRELLEKRARGLQHYLTHRGLVISQGGQIRKTHAPLSEWKLAEIREIVGSVTDLDERISAVQEIVGSKKMATAIAKHFPRE